MTDADTVDQLEADVVVSRTPEARPADPGVSEPDGGSPRAERRVAGWIGKAVRVEGKVISTEDLTIDGEVEGAIELGNNSLTIGLGAGVKANVTAKTVVINGTVTGSVHATERVDLRATGAVEGNIRTPRLSMSGGATVNGKVEVGKQYKR